MIARRLDMSEIVQQLLDSGAKQHLVSSVLSSVSLLIFYHNMNRRQRGRNLQLQLKLNQAS